jgi:hypothetical protein
MSTIIFMKNLWMKKYILQNRTKPGQPRPEFSRSAKVGSKKNAHLSGPLGGNAGGPPNPGGMRNTGLHIPVCFEDVPRYTDRKRESQIEHLKYNLVNNMNMPDGTSMSIHISINGESDEHWINEVNNLAEQYNAKEVFHRPNIGYQWGGYYDLFKKHEFTYDWFATLEVDCFLIKEWLHYASPTKRLHHIGMIPYKENAGRMPPEYQKPHTRGGFHMCSKWLLQRIDKKYKCFSDAKTSDYFENILKGEIGFCQKVLDCGYALNALPIIGVLDIK